MVDVCMEDGCGSWHGVVIGARITILIGVVIGEIVDTRCVGAGDGSWGRCKCKYDWQHQPIAKPMGTCTTATTAANTLRVATATAIMLMDMLAAAINKPRGPMARNKWLQ